MLNRRLRRFPENEALKAPRGRGVGRGSLSTLLGVGGSVVNFPSGVRGGAPKAIEFLKYDR